MTEPEALIQTLIDVVLMLEVFALMGVIYLVKRNQPPGPPGPMGMMGAPGKDAQSLTGNGPD